ncbi:gamma-glutamyltransferase [Sphingomonas nostoxanthinifaciens]|uniref:gamma-glutamyltransferase n=1 Tax=Sphingomonas nostoxanthinifaciens TaxID=2872652 RepID=UPI001CC1D05B|nr:gamma-glutamyltransferase [Sphingomonas nostoxanthinifaciens]UAK25834.1 gamma-glutamyltransferase [Sphingomonas nostoxanthinifaciens]
MRTYLLAAGLLVSSSAYAADPQPVAGSGGMVVSAQHIASEVGADILRHGGNAIDAAVAVGYALAVVYPQAGNIGGGGFMTLHLAGGRSTFLDFREKAPQAATAAMYQDAAGKVIPGLSTDSWKAVGIPGTVLGLETARIRYGTLPRATLMAPAIHLARDGFVLGQGDAGVMALEAKKLARDPMSARIFQPQGRPLTKGDRLVQADLAQTLSQISATGPDAFYKGPIGAAIANAARHGGGIITRADLASYKVRELEPIECDYRGFHVISAPPPSSGGVSICEALNILSGYDLAAMGFHSADEVHVLAEALRRVYVDRNNKLGDPDFVTNPIAELIAPAYAAKLRATIDPVRATPSSTLGPAVPEHEGHNTTQYDVVDAKGNAVSVTYTLNDWFGAHRVAGGTGIVMNDEMDDFTSKPGVPNMFGLVQGAANAIAPGKTPLSSMSPTIVTKDGKVALVIGSPGGSRIITITLEAILNMIDHGMDVQEAIDAPRIHEQWLPDTISLEPFALSPDTRRLLEQRGYRFEDEGHWGIAEGIAIGAPRLTSSNSAGSAFLSLGAPPLKGATMFGAHDARGGAGSAEPVN